MSTAIAILEAINVWFSSLDLLAIGVVLGSFCLVVFFFLPSADTRQYREIFHPKGGLPPRPPIPDSSDSYYQRTREPEPMEELEKPSRHRSKKRQHHGKSSD